MLNGAESHWQYGFVLNRGTPPDFNLNRASRENDDEHMTYEILSVFYANQSATQMEEIADK